MDMMRNRLVRILICLCFLNTAYSGALKLETTGYMKDLELIDCYGNPVKGGLNSSGVPKVTVYVDTLIDRACYMEVTASAGTIETPAAGDNILAAWVNVGAAASGTEYNKGIDKILATDNKGMSIYCQRLITNNDVTAKDDTSNFYLGGGAKAAAGIKKGLCGILHKTAGALAVSVTDTKHYIPAATYGISWRLHDLNVDVSGWTAQDFGSGYKLNTYTSSSTWGTSNHTIIFGSEKADNSAATKNHVSIGTGVPNADFETEWVSASSKIMRVNIKQMLPFSAKFSVMGLKSPPIAILGNDEQIALSIGTDAQMVAMKLQAANESTPINLKGSGQEINVVQVITTDKTVNKPLSGTEFLAVDIDSPARGSRNIFVWLSGTAKVNGGKRLTEYGSSVDGGDAGQKGARTDQKIFLCAWPNLGCFTHATMKHVDPAGVTLQTQTAAEAAQLRIDNGLDMQVLGDVWETQAASVILKPSATTSKMYHNKNDIYVYNPLATVTTQPAAMSKDILLVPSDWTKTVRKSFIVPKDIKANLGALNNPYFAPADETSITTANNIPTLGRSSHRLDQIGASTAYPSNKVMYKDYYNQGMTFAGTYIHPTAYKIATTTRDAHFIHKDVGTANQAIFRWSPVYSIPVTGGGTNLDSQAAGWFKIAAGAIQTRAAVMSDTGVLFQNGGVESCIPYKVYAPGVSTYDAAGKTGMLLVNPAHHLVVAGCGDDKTDTEPTKYIKEIKYTQETWNDADAKTNMKADQIAKWVTHGTGGFTMNRGLGEYGKPGYIAGEQAHLHFVRFAISMKKDKITGDVGNPGANGLVTISRDSNDAVQGQSSCKSSDFSRVYESYSVADTTAGQKGITHANAGAVGATECASIVETANKDNERCMALPKDTVYPKTADTNNSYDNLKWTAGSYYYHFFDKNKLPISAQEKKLTIKSKDTTKATILKCGVSDNPTGTGADTNALVWTEALSYKISVKKDLAATKLYDMILVPNTDHLKTYLGLDIPSQFKLPEIIDPEDLFMYDYSLFKQEAYTKGSYAGGADPTESLIWKNCRIYESNMGFGETNLNKAPTSQFINQQAFTECFNVFGPSVKTGTDAFNTRYQLYTRKTGSGDARYMLQRSDPTCSEAAYTGSQSSCNETTCMGFKLGELANRSGSKSGETKSTDMTAWRLTNGATGEDFSKGDHGYYPFTNRIANKRYFMKGGTTKTEIGTVRLLVTNNTNAIMTKASHYCYVQIHKCSSENSQTCSSWTKMMPDPYGLKVLGRPTTDFECVKADVDGSGGVLEAAYADKALDINNMYNINLDLMDYMLQGYKFSLWFRGGKDHMWLKHSKEIIFGAATSAASTSQLVVPKAANPSALSAWEQADVKDGITAKISANFTTDGLNICLVPTGSDAFRKSRYTVCDTQINLGNADKSTNGHAFSADGNTWYYKSEGTNNGLGKAFSGADAAAKLYPGNYTVYTRNGDKRAKADGSIRVYWKTTTDVITQEAHPGVCISDCAIGKYGPSVITANLSATKPTNNEYVDNGNGKIYYVPDAKLKTGWYVSWVFFAEAMTDKKDHYVYWSSRTDCDCSQGLCDKNMGTAKNLMTVKNIPGTYSYSYDKNFMTWFGDAGCQHKKRPMKFYFPKGQKQVYNLCVQEYGQEKFVGKPVKHTTSTGSKVNVTIQIETSVPTAPTTPGSKSTGTTPISPSPMTKLSGLTTIVLALMGIFFM